MSLKIYKYPIKITDEQTISMPEDREMLHAGLDPTGVPCVWAKVDTETDAEEVTISVRGTGRPCDDLPQAEHIGSFVHGPYMWHVFEGC